MKTLKLIAALVLALFAITATAQTTNPPTFIRGGMEIRYNSRVKPGTVNVPDDYNMNMNISNSAVFKGNIKHLPYIPGTFSVSQNSSIRYEIACDVVNPRNPAQTKNIGRIYGAVPIDPNGTYKYNDGNLVLGLVGGTSGMGAEAKFGGITIGKPLARQSGWFDSLKREAINLTRSSNGKNMSLAIKKYDKMTFQMHTMAAGPIGIYPEATVNGDMIYDYDRSVWFFNNVTITYYANGGQKVDKLTGNIRWQESPQRKSNGEGQYDFDIRVNEPPPSESASFATATDESAFFATDTTIPSLTGAMKYKDSINPSGTVVSSIVNVDLTGNQLSKQSVMNVFKLVFFSCIVPFNAE